MNIYFARLPDHPDYYEIVCNNVYVVGQSDDVQMALEMLIRYRRHYARAIRRGNWQPGLLWGRR